MQTQKSLKLHQSKV